MVSASKIPKYLLVSFSHDVRILSWFGSSIIIIIIIINNIIIIIIIIIHSLELFISALTDGYSLESEWPQVSRTLLSILAVLNNDVVWMVSTRLPTSKSSIPFSNPLVTVPNAPITIGIIVTCMFHSFFNSLARSRYLSFFSHSSFYYYYTGQQFFTFWMMSRFLQVI